MATADTVHQHARRTMRLTCHGDGLLRGQRIGDVTGNGERTNLVGNPLDTLGVDVDHRHLGTRLNEIARRFGTQARCRPGHYRRTCP
ncbi:MAG: hypothetical protein CAPSK01_004749 [Candidatus Accumulibacter vicinus]|uniref:Uncharacterized protein n=1 Tax=Candidatus Accumulibacter vicinus TaxID=2954382 RepID=A0A084XTW6_9PROT|nr:MAG: hypothetical protein CAPSK01_004749 [Candidatus Accumulibacter vicinus]